MNNIVFLLGKITYHKHLKADYKCKIAQIKKNTKKDVDKEEKMW